MEVVACETCHMPQLYAPAIQLRLDSDQPQTARQVTANARHRRRQQRVTNLVTGFKPVLLQRTNVDGDTLLAPYNLVTTWYWVYDDANGNTRPVRLLDLEAACLRGRQLTPLRSFRFLTPTVTAA